MKDGIIGNIVTVTIDRPKGSHHPVYKDLCYPINDGYIDGVMAPDGEEQDAYIIGVDEPVKKFTGKVVAIIHRKDDIEDKWVACPENMTYTKSEIFSMVYFQEQYFDYEVIVASEEANRVMEDYSIALGEIRSYASHRSHPVFTELQEAGRELRSGEEIDYHFKWNIVNIDESHIYILQTRKMGTVTIYPSLFLLRSMLMCIVSGKMGLRSRPSQMNKNVWRFGRFVIIIWLFCLFSIKKYTEIPFFCLKRNEFARN